MTSQRDTTDTPGRDSDADSAQVAAARRRPMAERLEVALSWNAVAAELRAGLATVTGKDHVPPR